MSRTLMRAGLCLLLLVIVPGLQAETWGGEPAPDGQAPVPASRLDSTADHRKFAELTAPLETGPQVTRVCLKCHTEAARQVQESIHWTWDFRQPETGQRLGKRNIINNLCLMVPGNEPRCTSCHNGYGWDEPDYDLTLGENVDCLSCHDTTGTYEKFPTGAGHPPLEDRTFQGQLIEAPDLNHVARNVGKTSRETCGSCHFEGGGGDAVKHGDLDSTLLDPPRSVDVHMSPEGGDFSCSTCHEFSGHRQEGSRYLLNVSPDAGISIPGRENERPACESCHGHTPHDPKVHNKLNRHSEFIACQTCHVPELARGGRATKTLWDWSTAGRLDGEGRPVVETNDQGRVTYHGNKGSMEWAEDYPPVYRWFNGNMRYTLPGEGIDPSGPVDINTPEGAPGATGARIWPFKIMAGRQPYDTQHRILLPARLFGPEEDAFWTGYDWDQALAAGVEAARGAGHEDLRYSGEYDFVDTRMYWPVNHMVAPAEGSLGCAQCHAQDARLEGLPGVYIPGRDRHPWIETVGWWAVGGVFVLVLLHGGLRYVLYRRERRAIWGR